MKSEDNPHDSNIVSIALDINAQPGLIWDIITNKKYAKELGNVFDKNAFVESDWKLGSEVQFKYEPDRLVCTGIIGAWIENQLIRVDYDFSGFKYVEKYSIERGESFSTLAIYAGP